VLRVGGLLARTGEQVVETSSRVRTRAAAKRVNQFENVRRPPNGGHRAKLERPREAARADPKPPRRGTDGNKRQDAFEA